MQEMTQEQSARLLSFAEQRDVLQKEVSKLTKERDSLLAVNKELTATNSQLVSEIGENQRKAKTYVDELIESIGNTVAERINAEKELLDVVAQKVVAQRELESVTALILKIKELTDGVKAEAEEINENLRSAHGRVNQFLSTIKESADDIVASSTNVKNAAERFADTVSKEHEVVAKKSESLDKKEIMLNDRETAINELVADYKKVLNKK